MTGLDLAGAIPKVWGAYRVRFGGRAYCGCGWLPREVKWLRSEIKIDGRVELAPVSLSYYKGKAVLDVMPTDKLSLGRVQMMRATKEKLLNEVAEWKNEHYRLCADCGCETRGDDWVSARWNRARCRVCELIRNRMAVANCKKGGKGGD